MMSVQLLQFVKNGGATFVVIPSLTEAMVEIFIHLKQVVEDFFF
jgi:hypothetical protein